MLAMPGQAEAELRGGNARGNESRGARGRRGVDDVEHVADRLRLHAPRDDDAVTGDAEADRGVQERRNGRKQGRQRGLARDARLAREMRVAYGAEYEVGAGCDSGRAANRGW